MAQCKGRYADKELTFTNGREFYTEIRCLGKALTGDLCKKCVKNEHIPFNPRLQLDQFQGKVGEEYFKKSVLYGSPWYLKKVERDNYEVSQENLATAKQAQRDALYGTQMPRKKKEEAPAPAAPAPKEVKPEVKQEVKPKKPRAPRKKKEETPPPPPAPEPAAPIAVESAEEPLEALEVIKIPVILKTIHGKQFWYDSKKSKVYELKKDKTVGQYLGRFDSAEDKIVDFPDSDVDV